MPVEWSPDDRSHSRLPMNGCATASVAWGDGSHSYPLQDLSMAGISFQVAGPTVPGWLAVGRSIERVVVTIDNHLLHGDLVPAHVSPAAGGGFHVGARFYPATEIDHDGLTLVITALERGAPNRTTV